MTYIPSSNTRKYTSEYQATLERQVVFDTENVAGREIVSAYVEDDTLVVLFRDGSWAAVCANSHFEDLEQDTLPYVEDCTLLHAGVIDLPTYEAQRAHEAKYRAEKQRQKRRAEYIRLRKEFENG